MNIDGDHSKSVKQIMKSGINVYTSPGTAEALSISGHRLKVVEPLKTFTIGTFKILAFPTQHDCAQPYGFLLLSDNGDKILFATDTYFLKYKFLGLTHILIEANYSKKILDESIKSGVTPAFIRNRIMRSHFSLENVKEFFKANDLSAVKEIYLIHLSANNICRKTAIKEIKELTGKPTFSFDKEGTNT